MWPKTKNGTGMRTAHHGLRSQLPMTFIARPRKTSSSLID